TSPDDGIITLEIDPVNINGLTDLEVVLSLSCNAEDEAYDDRSQLNGDYIDVQVNIDGSGWNTIGQFNSRAGGSAISTLYYDLDMDGDGGELGEVAVGNGMTDYVIPFSGTGTSAEVRLLIKMDGGDEVIVVDDIRLKESEGDVMPPTVFSAQVIDQNTLQVVFNEELGANAEQNFLYSGVSGLSSATLQADEQTVILDYGTDFVTGDPYQLIVFGVQDAAGNAMAGAFSFPFYWNPTTPELVFTELMYNDPSIEDTLEFIEIYNHGVTTAILGGFRLEGAVTHTLASVTIEPEGFYLVARNAVAAQNFYNLSFEDYGGQLSDNSEFLQLVNVDGIVLDSLTYNDNVPWPSAGDGFGPSIELVDPDFDNNIGSNWVASDNGLGFINGLPLSATPGTLLGGTLPVVQFDNNDIEVNEIDGVIEMNIYIAGSNSNQSVVEINFESGTATSPEDHGSNTISTLQLPANSDGIEPIAFPLVNDSELEGVEYFTLTMSAIGNCQIGLNNSITIIISDDEYQSPPLMVNELQSSNMTTIEDAVGEFDDWFEIYNPNEFEVDLAGYYLTDDPLNVQKERLDVGSSETLIQPFGFLLIWADEQGEQGPLHVNFKLNGAGESLYLTAPDGVTEIDGLDFGPIPSDNSFGRFCDGEDVWMEFSVPSPDFGNCVNGLQENSAMIQVYPNPTPDVLYLPEKGLFEVFDMTGRILLSGYDNRLDVSALSTGIYSIRFEKSGLATFIKE
ncbi:MAG: T9SS type A sorting domain-containing protein, partial [Flavobacteriales bacterium]|nr:T9SS type A sorting domain-containing protein [Flavobacteriales bacterium]